MGAAALSLSCERATFIRRDHCIACGSRALDTVACGRFCDEPVRGFIERSPWGECPLPYLQDAPWEYVACRDCEQTFHRYVLDDAWQARRFSEWMGLSAIQRFEAQHGLDGFSSVWAGGVGRIAHVLRLERLTRELRGPRAPRLLDFGCGFGELVLAASSMGFEACGVDWDTNRLSPGAHSRARFFRGLAELDASGPEPFHVVTLFQVLEHLVSPRDMLRWLRLHLVPGGVLVIEVPDTTGVSRIESMHDFRAIDPLDHINGFSPRLLVQFGAFEGFEPLRWPPVWVASDMKRMLKSTLSPLFRRLRPTTQVYFRLVR